MTMLIASHERCGARLQDLTQRVLADLDREAGASASTAPADLDALHDRWETAWRSRGGDLASRDG
jgi:hypothetical protein